MRMIIATAILFVILGGSTVLSMTTKPARSNDPPVADTVDNVELPPHLGDLLDDNYATYR